LAKRWPDLECNRDFSTATRYKTGGTLQEAKLDFSREGSMLFGRNWSTWLLLSLLAAMMLAAASCDSGVSRNADDYVGEYVFMPANAAANNFPTFIILKKDGST
jgi:hypothetical protein